MSFKGRKKVTKTSKPTAKRQWCAAWRVSVCFVFALMALLVAPMAANAESFLSAAPDIPLADGLVEVPDGVLVFDKPQGRIVQLTAARQGTATGAQTDAIADFYRATLPNLGWAFSAESESVLTFTGQAEILRLTFTSDLVIFDVTPRRQP